MTEKFATSNQGLVTLDAEPEPLQIDLQRSAIIIIDMQNCFVSRGGMFDLWGLDIKPCQEIVTPINKIAGAARASGVRIIYTAHQYSLDLREGGGPDSPMWYKASTITHIREHPEWRDKLQIRGTWGAQIVEQLKPQEDDIVIEKQRYSAFYQTNLDMILKTYGIRYLLFTGLATNICVESSVRDAFYTGYFPILISDACANAGPSYTQDATIYNIKLCYGWVMTSEDLLKTLLQASPS